MEQALRFKAMYSSLGLSVADVAQFLQVTPRTVHAWISGRVRIPFAAYKLLRLQLYYELPGDAWSGWHLSAGRLYTPEGHELHPADFTWWGLLVRRAALFSVLYKAQLPPRALAGDLPQDTAPGGPRLRGVAGAVAASKSLPSLPVSARVIARLKKGVREREREGSPMVITGRPLTVFHHMKPPAV
jgi:hypothetical protein